jgi:hypothetical protein
MEEEIGARFGWQRPEAEEEIYLVLASKCVRVPWEWPPLEVPGQCWKNADTVPVVAVRHS